MGLEPGCSASRSVLESIITRSKEKIRKESRVRGSHCGNGTYAWAGQMRWAKRGKKIMCVKA